MTKSMKKWRALQKKAKAFLTKKNIIFVGNEIIFLDSLGEINNLYIQRIDHNGAQLGYNMQSLAIVDCSFVSIASFYSEEIRTEREKMRKI